MSPWLFLHTNNTINFSSEFQSGLGYIIIIWLYHTERDEITD